MALSGFENLTSLPKDVSFKQIMDWTIHHDRVKCESSILKQPYPTDGNLYCNATFDGYSCWNYTRAGTRAYGKCPSFFVYKFGLQKAMAFRDCNSDGTWYRHPETNRTWSDYTTCTNTEKVRRIWTLFYVFFGGYSLSIVSLVIALSIFYCYRELKCTRITIHKNMFVSYLMSGTMWISYYASSSIHPDVLVENPIWCRLLHMLAQYSTTSNYTWMFCEGLYLHTLLICVFVNERNLLIVCTFIGWVIPAIQSAVYFGLRISTPDIDKICWNGKTTIQWIFLGPIALLLVINTVFLVNILRILCKKVKRVSQSESTLLRHSLKAALTLIPLLGVQYLAIPFRPVGNEDLLHVFDILSAVLVAFQGFVVSLLFCFFNGEVINVLKTRFGICVQRRMSRSDTLRSSMLPTIPPTCYQLRSKWSKGNIFNKEPDADGGMIDEEDDDHSESNKEPVETATVL